jgi:RNA polymerase sigma factor (TIGR02999 family)
MALSVLEPSLTELLRRYSGGDVAVAEALFREILPTLHQLAVRQLGRERHVAPVSPTELINELWLRNLRKGGWSIQNREHFYAIASLAMRRVLVDLARNRLAASRGTGVVPVSLDDKGAPVVPVAENLEQVVEMGQLMERLEEKDPVAARIVDMRYYAGYTLEEIAEFTGLEVHRVRYRWEKASNWLKDRLSD